MFTEIVPLALPVATARTPEFVIVTLSFVASPATEIPVPAAIVKLSVLESAAIVVEPTTTLENAFWLTSAPFAISASLFFSAVV